MVEVFTTNVAGAEQAAELIAMLQCHYPGGKISFDLEDCDKVLRVESSFVSTEQVIQLLQSAQCECDLLNC